MGYLSKMNGESGQNSFSTVGFSILGQPTRFNSTLLQLIGYYTTVSSLDALRCTQHFGNGRIKNNFGACNAPYIYNLTK